ncbi:MAG: hypothetical protein R6W78_05315 [Bacteroidales bacterium]
MRKSILKLFCFLLILLGALFIVRIKPSEISFGKYYGMCIENCTEIYSIDTCISKDTFDFFDNIEMFKNVEFKKPIRIYYKENYKKLKLDIPLFMILEPRGIIGCPDCYDQGGIFLRFKILCIKRSFLIDPNKQPCYYFNLNKEINKKISLINTPPQ